jgi:putative PIN family toxin of toxin-antitoxin system
MRAVLDTNEYVSALVFGGLPREILQRAERGDFELVVSAHIREEVERVLCDKFGWTLERVAEAIDPLWEVAHFVTPREKISASRDETDNRILECAIESGAQVIVSFDNDLLTLTPFEGIRILKAREFIELLDSGT